MIIKCCYDSHVHWYGTGYEHRLLSCRKFQSKGDLHRLFPTPLPDIDGWVLGSGWNDHSWPQNESTPNRLDLDEICSDRPMALWRADRHALWTNSLALAHAGLLAVKPNAAGQWLSTPLAQSDPMGGKILKDDQGLPTGILIDLAMNRVTEKIPKPSLRSIRESLFQGMIIFNNQGYTHIRDLSCDEPEWEAKLSLFEENFPMTLAVEQYFSADDPREFDRALEDALRARSQLTKQKPPGSHQIRVCGVKVYTDGALGSEGAWVSEPYLSGSGYGLSLMSDADLEEMMRKTWKASLALSVHALGDQAVAQVARCGMNLARLGIRGELHLEHLEIARPESLHQLAQLHAICHMQPSHWLSDHTWLEKKVPSLKRHYFPWNALERTGLKLYFGSDSPIEAPKLFDSIRAIGHAAHHGIARPLRYPNTPWRYHQHPDSQWISGCHTQFDPTTFTPTKVVFANTEVPLTPLTPQGFS